MAGFGCRIGCAALGAGKIAAAHRPCFTTQHQRVSLMLVVHNPGKQAMIPIARRVELIETALAAAGAPKNIVVRSWSMGLLVDYCTDVGASVIVKGLRGSTDVAYELPMALVNRHLGKLETMFLLPNPQHAHVSSSLVRQVAALGGDVSPYVPPVVREFLQGHMDTSITK